MSENIFITGATGFLGSYVLDHYLRTTNAKVSVLTRAKNDQEGREKLWKALQIHQTPEVFYRHIDRVNVVTGDLSAPKLGMSDDAYKSVVDNTDSILHIAASLNRKSEKSCLNHNLRGTLAMLKLAQATEAKNGLRRFSFVSTTAVAGKRQSETLDEDASIEWTRSDYDPYARTKKMCEHMVFELLPNVPKTIFRPSTVLGDSRFPETTQFEMVQAFNTIFELPLFPIRPEARVDIVNADWVGKAIFELHKKDKTDHEIYHLATGEKSPRAEQIAAQMREHGRRPPKFTPRLYGATEMMFNAIASMPQRNAVTYIGSLFKVFLPYICFDTVFKNDRAVNEIGVAPTSFLEYGPAYTAWCKNSGYRYPYAPLPPAPTKASPEARA